MRSEGAYLLVLLGEGDAYKPLFGEKIKKSALRFSKATVWRNRFFGECPFYIQCLSGLRPEGKGMKQRRNSRLHLWDCSTFQVHVPACAIEFEAFTVLAKVDKRASQCYDHMSTCHSHTNYIQALPQKNCPYMSSTVCTVRNSATRLGKKLRYLT